MPCVPKHLTGVQPMPLPGGFKPGDHVYAASSLQFKSLGSFHKSSEIREHERGTILGRNANHLSQLTVQFDDPTADFAKKVQVGAEEVLTREQYSAAVQKRAAEREAAERSLMLELEKKRLAALEERNRHDDLLAEAKVRAKEKAEADRAAKVAKAEQQREARWAEAKAAEAQGQGREGLGPAIYLAASKGEIKQLKKLLERLKKEKPTSRRAIQQYAAASAVEPRVSAPWCRSCHLAPLL